MKKSLLNEAIRTAKQKLQYHPEFKNHPHYSFIVQYNKIIEWATNIRAEPPRHWGYHLKDRGEDYKPKFHSEARAYLKAKGLLDDSPFEIINIKLTRTGLVRLSAPCTQCFELLSALGCRSFYYSSTVGFLRKNTYGY